MLRRFLGDAQEMLVICAGDARKMLRRCAVDAQKMLRICSGDTCEMMECFDALEMLPSTIWGN